MGGVNYHLVPYLTDIGLSGATAVAAMSLYGILAGATRFPWGLIAERLHVRYCLTMVCFGAAIGMVLLLLVRGAGAAYTFAVVYGLGVGGVPVLGTIVWASYFGRRYYGSIRGFANVFQMASLGGGPLFAAWIYDSMGSYEIAFASFAAAFLFAGVLVLMARPPRQPRVVMVPVTATSSEVKLG